MLREIQVFLEGNPTEIVSIFIEDYVSSPRGLSKVFNASGVSQYLFPLSRMPKNGEDWPTVDDMVQKNQRLVVFTSKSSKEASEGLAYEWNYVVENQCESFLFSYIVYMMINMSNLYNGIKIFKLYHKCQILILKSYLDQVSLSSIPISRDACLDI